MKKSIFLTVAVLGGIGVLPVHAEEAAPPVTVYVTYDTSIPPNAVITANFQTSRMFAKIGMPVRFRYGSWNQRAARSGLELDMHIAGRAPAGAHPETLGTSHPFRQDARIEVFYERIQNYSPELGRNMLLACIMAHEITHALEQLDRHAATGVMKVQWNFEDLNKIRSGLLEFDRSDVELIRAGIEKRVRAGNMAQLNSIRQVSASVVYH